MRIIYPLGYKDPIKFQKLLHDKKESYWTRLGEKRALKLFHEMAQRVPAYQDFLQKNQINHESIKTIVDFNRIPPIDKNNYLRVYPRSSLCWDGKFSENQWTISTTSGSTGSPFYFPRTKFQDQQYALTAELYLRENFQIHKKSTLYIIAFPMGAWIGGLFTYQAIRYITERGKYPLSVITPGINKLEIINAVRNLGHDFDQVIIGSYAPFLKDFIEDGIRMGLNWKDYQIGFIFSAECISETCKDYLAGQTGITDIFRQTLNHYGTVDLGTMSHETPLSIWMRRIAIDNPELYEALFSDVSKLPTLTQYNPAHFYFEDVGGNLYCSAYSGLPLVRYDLKDRGGVFKLEDMKLKWQQHGLNIDQEIKLAGLSDTVWNLPFVYVYERSDFSVNFFAFQIYPETIRKALQEKDILDLITGKFMMQVYYEKDGLQIFEINIELEANKKETNSLRAQVLKLIVERLIHENSEYRKTHEIYPDKTIPKLVFWPYEDPKYFCPGIKQKWVKK